MYHNLLEHIDNQTDANKEQVINFLRDAVDVVSSISDDKISSTEHAKTIFDNAYKEIAANSITSYKNTNQKFEKLTKMHEDAINNCSSEMIDLPSLTAKFEDIQSHMMDEVKKANSIISQLSAQVETLERDSNLDSLTKVYNRRALSNYLEQVCKKKDLEFELHLLILDIDDFKIVNDTYGHIAGDKILIFIANILRKTLRRRQDIQIRRRRVCNRSKSHRFLSLPRNSDKAS
jgi:predicted signal transduction protein with EAL and GGDEF domain